MRWIIGDIHGMLRPLETLVAAIDRHDKERQLLFVGDYVNRGPQSKEVIDLLLTLPQCHFVRGNHDDVFDQVLSGMSLCGKSGEEPRVAAFQWFMQHGLDKTLLSYGISHSQMQRALRRPSGSGLDFLVEPVPAEHRRFIRNLPVVLESEDLFVAHAKWDIHTATDAPPIAERIGSSDVRYSLLWGRYRADEIEAEKPAWTRTGYFGHTPVDSYIGEGDELLPVAGPKCVLLDTAVALVAKGRLSAFCHETGTFIQADPEGKLVVPP
jgi:serine/threonine protein phosphatase 1